ncbi:unnamed protein product [Rotaria socialis]|uniref:Sulfotransferase n=1 Tax=Rotaria socialis TaxID=392032 RepID=A0A820FN15_9BILA|nr:unnamed protein product [Rotaria socialis]CAF3371778.1 unnamed protein product [Rotaria socialis]CAF3544511.1 unnamed protein product [Rotaria socialis]CAF3554472.1 unnamed protein product [Rotaria socialis]CAF3599938.1 unnamed protein product [Rotaria socialis]
MSAELDEVIQINTPLLNDITLHENDLTEEAKNRFSYHKDILEAFELCRRTILENYLLTKVGRHLLLRRIVKLHADCKRVLNYVAANTEILNHDLPTTGPLVICGLPRTGSTLLHNLLACDPNCRAPLLTDMCIECAPPIPRSNTIEHERRMLATIDETQLCEQLVGRKHVTVESHPKFIIEEDYNVLQQTGVVITLVYLSALTQTEIGKWIYDEKNKTFTYDYQKTFLRMLNIADAPKSHWVLKSPEHSLYLDLLFAQYPDAAVIMTHRRLDEVLPSFCRMSWIFDNIYFHKDDSLARATSATRAIQHIDKMIERIVEYRTRSFHSHSTPHKTIFDVDYNDLAEQPIATVRRIYDHFNLSWSEEFEKAMNAWLRANPQGKQGRHRYSLDEYGLTIEEIETRYADYNRLFLRSCQPLQTAFISD